MSQTIKGEHEYFNVLVAPAPGTGQCLASFTKTFSEEIIKKASNYSLAIDRFRIPMDSIPIMQFDTATNAYTVEMEYNGVFSGRVPVQYIPTSNIPATEQAYYWVWTFDTFILMVNNAIKSAFDALSALTTLPTGAKQPFIALDLKSRYLTINFQVAHYDYTSSQPIKLYMNQKLWSHFDGIAIVEVGNVIGVPSANGRDALFIPFNQFNNVVEYGTENYYEMGSDNGFECLAKWNMCKGFYFRTNTLPVRYEIMPSLEFVNGELTYNNNLVSQPIVCNFDILYSSESPKPLIAQMVLGTPYKIIDLVGTNNIKSIDLQVFWYDKYNNSYPLYIRQGETMSVRLVFQEKI